MLTIYNLKMKQKLIITLLFLCSIPLFSQESFMDKIALETCEFLQTEEMLEVSADKRSEKLGLFIINLYNQYEDELLTEGFEINFIDGSNSGREFGEEVGMHMAKFCPEVLIALANDTEDEIVEEIYETSGKLIEVTGNEFSTLVLKDADGKTQKFLWLQNFKGSDELIEVLENSKNKPELMVTYRNIECYSPQLKEYIIRKEILEVNFIN